MDLIDIAIPWDKNIDKPKREKQRGMKSQQEKLEKINSVIYPFFFFFFDAIGTVTGNLSHLKDFLQISDITGIAQVSAMPG